MMPEVTPEALRHEAGARVPDTVVAVAVAVDGDVAAFDRMYVATRPAMVRLAYFLTGSPSAAEEVAQDAFVQMLERWDRIDDPPAYLRTCVVNRSRSWHRRRLVALRRMSGLAVPGHHDDRPDELADALARLPRRRREVIVLRYYEQLTVPEIAVVLDVGEGTVKSSIHRGLAQLRGVLT